jgi:hypothetical protein
MQLLGRDRVRKVGIPLRVASLVDMRTVHEQS